MTDLSLDTFIFYLRFTPCKAEQPLRGMELQEKDRKILKHTGNLFRKKPTSKRCLLILDLKSHLLAHRLKEIIL